jgi:hypothetical protein
VSEGSDAVEGLRKLLARWQGWMRQSEGSGFGPPLLSLREGVEGVSSSFVGVRFSHGKAGRPTNSIQIWVLALLELAITPIYS